MVTFGISLHRTLWALLLLRGRLLAVLQGRVRLLRVRRERSFVELAHRMALEGALDAAVHHAPREPRAGLVELLDLRVDGVVVGSFGRLAQRGHLRLDLAALL